MAKKRLTDVIREEVGDAGVHSWDAFTNLATVKERYPKIADAINDEAELRPTIGGPAKVLERLVKPWFAMEYGPKAEYSDAEPGSRGSQVE